MHNPTSVVPRCTAQRRNGEFCDAPTAPDMPFPICVKHAARVFQRFEANYQSQVRMIREVALRASRSEQSAGKRLRDEAARKKAQTEQSVVYYIRIADYIKIGYTVNLKARLGNLRVDEDALIATEPGGRDLERERHLQFAEERIGRRENFNPSNRLQAHINDVLVRNGPPQITTYVKL